MGISEILKRYPDLFTFFSFSGAFLAFLKFYEHYFDGNVPEFIKDYAWMLVPGLVAVLCVKYFIFDKAAYRDSDDCLDKCAYVLKTSERLLQELYIKEDSVVKGAREFIHVMGSRSRDRPYLEAIEASLILRRKLRHSRVLVGEPHHNILIEHIERVRRIREERDFGVGDGDIKVSLYDLGGKVPERFIVVSERKILITLPSLSSAGGYDTALVIDNAEAAKNLGAIVHTLAQQGENVLINDYGIGRSGE